MSAFVDEGSIRRVGSPPYAAAAKGGSKQKSLPVEHFLAKHEVLWICEIRNIDQCKWGDIRIQPWKRTGMLEIKLII